MRDFRRILASIVLAAPLGGCTCPTFDETVAVPTMPGTPFTIPFDLAQCQADATACEPLCQDVYKFTTHGGYANFTKCELLVDPISHAPLVHYAGTDYCVGGRRPAGYRSKTSCGSVGEYLARQAELEAASVRAFEDLLADLLAHRAPMPLCYAARRAASDEVRHARLCDALARRHGVAPRYETVSAAPRRDRRALAVDNAVEGCVRETFGAVVGGYQARAAGDPEIRRAMNRIWRDEADHAALSWQLDRWLAPRLDDADRRAVRDAARAARSELAADAAPAELRRVAGLPEPAVARAMLDALAARVWSALA
jgi:hypothetical protein